MEIEVEGNAIGGMIVELAGEVPGMTQRRPSRPGLSPAKV
jgi:hypothetical protein